MSSSLCSMMKGLLLSSLLLLAVADSCFAVFTGSISTQGGSSCKWSEKVLEGNMRGIAFDCQCRDDKGKALQYTCEYTGNPFVCSLFSVQGGQERFYNHLAHSFRGNYKSSYIFKCSD